METFIFILLALIAGISQPIQSGVNGSLKSETNSPYLSGAISNLIGAFLMLLFAFLLSGKQQLIFPKFELDRWWIWTGGILSMIIVVSTIIIPAKISYSTFFATFITGQLLMATIIDRFALFGGESIQISTKHIIGIIFLVIGVILVKK